MIGVYVHKRSHLHRALPVVAALRERGEEVILLAAGPLAETLRPLDLPVVHLPVDEGWQPPVGGTVECLDLLTRRAALSWVERTRPRTFWVDSSPAMSLAVHLTGTPVVSTVPPGVRRDEPHVLQCRSAETLIGPWPPGLFPETVAGAGAPVREIGGISRFELRARSGGSRRRPRIVHLNSAGPRGDHRFWRAVREAVLQLGTAEWVEIGGPDSEWRDDPWPELSAADVVVTCAGQSSVAEAACCDVPMVVVPRRHQYGEQQATARALRALPGVAVRSYGDGPTAVARTVCAQVDASRRSGSTGIRAAWRVDGAAVRAAEVIRRASTTTG